MSDEVIPVCSAKSPLAGRSLTLKQFVKTPLAVRGKGFRHPGTGTKIAVGPAYQGQPIYP